MKNFFTALMVLVGLGYSTMAVSQTTTVKKVLYRVNTGGIQELSIDTSTVDWITDNFTKPCEFIDTNIVGNKVTQVLTSVPLDASVPSTTPPEVFKDDRSMGNWTQPGLEYKFPIPAGKEVEVRLFFAEIYFTEPNQRVFDIIIEGNLVMNDFDIVSDIGANKGVMKKFTATSDGTLNIFLKRVKQLPTISAIEIIGPQDIQIAGIFEGKKHGSSLKAFPNPFINEVKVNVGEMNPQLVKLFDSFGREINVSFETASSELQVQTSNLAKGVYYLQIIQSESIETIRLVKE